MTDRTKRTLPRRLAYSIKRLASACDVGRSFLYEEINAGRLIAHKAGRRTIIRRVDACRWLRALPILGANEQLGKSEPAPDNITEVLGHSN